MRKISRHELNQLIGVQKFRLQAQNDAWELTQSLSWLIGRSDSKTFSFLEAELEARGSK